VPRGIGSDADGRAFHGDGGKGQMFVGFGIDHMAGDICVALLLGLHGRLLPGGAYRGEQEHEKCPQYFFFHGKIRFLIITDTYTWQRVRATSPSRSEWNVYQQTGGARSP
jgi:hypothetical protein